MRILFISNYYPPFEVGGYEQLCRDVVERLVERGHTTAVLTSDRGVQSNTEAEEPNIYRLLRTQPKLGTPLSPIAQFFLTRRSIEYYDRAICRQIVQQFAPEVVFVWNLQGLPQELALDAEALESVAVAYWLAGYTPAEPDTFWRYWAETPKVRTSLARVKNIVRHLAWAQMRREGKPVRPEMRHVAVVSDYMRRKGSAENTLPPHAEVIYNGIEVDRFYRPVPLPDTPPPINILVAGRVSPDKGIHVAIEAVGKLVETRPQHDFRLLIAGSGPEPYLAHLQRLVEAYKLEKLVTFMGWLPREEIHKLMHDSHVLILPSLHPEAFARVVLEAMAAGLVVVATLTGGTGELLQEGINGLTHDTEDSQELARQVNRLLDDPHLRHRLACRGQEMVLQQYSLERMVNQVESFLERAIAEQKSDSLNYSKFLG